jgi:hypothetical protein
MKKINGLDKLFPAGVIGGKFILFNPLLSVALSFR